MAAVPVGTTILADNFESGSWTAPRTPDAAYGGLVWGICTNGVVAEGVVTGTQQWDSGINDHVGGATPSEAIETTGYRISLNTCPKAGAPMPGGGYWAGVNIDVYSDAEGAALEGRVGVSGYVGSNAMLSVWGAEGGESFEMPGETLTADGFKEIRVDVGTTRQDYYYGGNLKFQTFRTVNKTIGLVGFNIGFSNAKSDGFEILTIVDIAPPEPVEDTFHIRDDFEGTWGLLQGRSPNIVEGVPGGAEWSADGMIANPGDPGDPNNYGWFVGEDAGLAYCKGAAV